MRFPYKRFPVQGTNPNTTVLSIRPMIDVRVTGPTGDDDVFDRVDTGADDTLLPDRLIASLGITDLTGPLVIGGVGGATLVRFGTVDLEINQGQTSIRWAARVGFSLHPNALFGLKGFLQFFTAKFNGRRHYLDLLPNGTALPSALPALDR
jgi:hypothetical protein